MKAKLEKPRREQTEVPKMNLNTILMFVMIAVMGWAGNTLIQLSKDVTVLQTVTSTKSTQLDRIEADLTKHRELISDIQRDVAVMKTKR